MTVMYNPKMIRQFEMNQRFATWEIRDTTKRIVYKCNCGRCRIGRARLEFRVLVAKEYGFKYDNKLLMEVGKHDRKNPIGRMRP